MFVVVLYADIFAPFRMRAHFFVLLACFLLTGCAAQKPITFVEGTPRAFPGDKPLPPKTTSKATEVSTSARDLLVYQQGENLAKAHYHVSAGARIGAFVGGLATGPIAPILIRNAVPRHPRLTERRIEERRLSSNVVLRQVVRVPIDLDYSLQQDPDFLAGYRHEALAIRRRALRTPATISSIAWGLTVVGFFVAVISLNGLGGGIKLF